MEPEASSMKQRSKIIWRNILGLEKLIADYISNIKRR